MSVRPQTSMLAGELKVLVFDVFGTVVDWRGTVIAEGEQLGKARGIALDWAAFADAWRAEYAPSMNKVRTGELPWTRLDVLHRMSLDRLLERFGLDGLGEDEKVRLNRVWHRCRPWPDAVEALTRLKARYVIAPMSNGNIALMTNMAKHGGLPWDCILGAELVRHYKPDPETYRSAAEFFDVTPAEVMMVAAHQGDLQVPKKLGIRTAYVHRPLEFGSRDKAPALPAAGDYDFSVGDLRELAAALGA